MPWSGDTQGGANCTLIVSKKVTFEGTVNIANACLEAGINSGIEQTRVRIME